MKRWLVDRLICPECTALEMPLTLTIREEHGEDVWDGALRCLDCDRIYPIRGGVADLLPGDTRAKMDAESGYNTPAMLSAYLWSHYSDLIGDPQATDAYRQWSSRIPPRPGPALDVGCAVGRLTFELADTHAHVIGIDASAAFIRSARQILTSKRLDFDLIIEGNLSEPWGCAFSDRNWEGVEFIVADALALPFRSRTFATIAALNILEKVPDPLQHLMEVNRTLKPSGATFLFSDPFSWDPAVSPPETWLVGSGEGNSDYSPRGIDTLRRMFTGAFDLFDPPFEIVADGEVAWKIRKTANLWEHITSQYLVGQRD
ncbi:MAG: methyltransferase domain-containing protein [Desulfosarcinaceae bacterium]|nr:methyltransferase domain-containing protein [Desulfosarcinaceae bacterium]